MPRAIVDDRDPDGVRPALLGPTSQSSLVVLLPEAVQVQLKRQRLAAPHAALQVALEVTYALEPPTAGLIFTWDRPATDLKAAPWTSCYTQTEVGSSACTVRGPKGAQPRAHGGYPALPWSVAPPPVGHARGRVAADAVGLGRAMPLDRGDHGAGRDGRVHRRQGAGRDPPARDQRQDGVVPGAPATAPRTQAP